MADIIKPKSKIVNKPLKALTIEEQEYMAKYLMSLSLKKCRYKNVFLIQMFTVVISLSWLDSPSHLMHFDGNSQPFFYCLLNLIYYEEICTSQPASFISGRSHEAHTQPRLQKSNMIYLPLKSSQAVYITLQVVQISI